MKKISKKLISLGFSVFLTYFMGTSCYGAVVFSDGEFSPNDWTHTVYELGTGGVHTISQEQSGGNPNAYLYIQNTVNEPTNITWVGGSFIKNDAVYNPAVNGAIQSIDYREDAIMFSGFGQGQASFAVLQQDNSLYFHFPFLTTNYDNWTHLGAIGLTANDFVLFDTALCSTPPACIDLAFHPDFSKTGALLTFGFARANSASLGASGYTITGGIDNWEVTVNQQVPVPAALVLFASGITGLLLTKFRRYQSS